MVLIIFIAEIAAAVVVLVYTSLVSGLAGCWAGVFWDAWDPFRKTGEPGGAACGLGGRDTKLVPAPWDSMAGWRGCLRCRQRGGDPITLQIPLP